MHASPNQPYEAPAISEVGSLEDLTLDVNKDYAPTSDGYTFHNQPINAS